MFRIHTLIVAAAVTAAGISSLPAGASPVHRAPAFSVTQAHAVHLGPALGRFTVTPPSYPWTRPLSELRTPSYPARMAHLPVQPDSYPKKCTYLSDNATGNVTVYYDTTTSHNLYLTLPAVYGWGVTTDYKVAYLGTNSDTIDVYAPCNPTLIATLTGTPALGYPLGIATAKNFTHTVYANEFPSGGIDEWVGMTYVSHTTDDPHCSAAGSYFLDSDRVGNVYLTCFDGTGTNEIVDFCNPPPFTSATCTTIATISGGFPGGIAVQTINPTSNAGAVFVSDQYGIMHKYRCTGMNVATPPICTGLTPWSYITATGQPTPPATDYLALSMPKAAKHVTAANISYCTSSGPICGDGQDQLVAPWPPSPGFDWNTLPVLINGLPYGVADYPAVL